MARTPVSARPEVDPIGNDQKEDERLLRDMFLHVEALLECCRDLSKSPLLVGDIEASVWSFGERVGMLAPRLALLAAEVRRCST